MGAVRFAAVGFMAGERETDYFEEITTDEETEVDGRPARRITGSDDLDIDTYPTCGTRIEVEPGVILLVEVSVGLTDDYSKDDDALLAAACDILDTFLPMVTAQIPE